MHINQSVNTACVLVFLVGGLLGVSALHSSLPNNFFTGPGRLASTAWTAGRLTLHCNSNTPPYTTPALPTSPLYTPRLYADALSYDRYLTEQPSTPETRYQVRCALPPCWIAVLCIVSLLLIRAAMLNCKNRCGCEPNFLTGFGLFGALTVSMNAKGVALGLSIKHTLLCR